MRVDVAEQLRLVIAAQTVLARAFDGLAAASGTGLPADTGPQCWYAADTCRRQMAALAPFMATYQSADDQSADNQRDTHQGTPEQDLAGLDRVTGTADLRTPDLRMEDILLLASVVALGWEMLGMAALAVPDAQLRRVVEIGGDQTHGQLDWLIRTLYHDALPNQSG